MFTFWVEKIAYLKFLCSTEHKSIVWFQFSSVQLLSHVRLFATPWITACQDSLSITNSWSISHASEAILKILQARLQQYVNLELPDVQTELRKGRGTRDQITNICWIIEKQENSRKTSASLTVLKPLTVWITANSGKFFKSWEYQTTLPASREICMQVKKQQLELVSPSTCHEGMGQMPWS